MKILFAASDDVTLHRGGPYVYLTHIKKALENKGIDVGFFDYWDAYSEFKNSDLVHLFGSRLPVYNFAKNLYNEKVKFVVNPIFYTRRSKRTVKFICRLDNFTRKNIRGFWWDYCFTKDICNWADKVLPNTQDEGRLIAEGMEIEQNKFEVIPNGVSQEFKDANPILFREKYGMDKFILTVGHIGPDRKNVLRLVKALETIDHPAVFIGRRNNAGETARVMELASRNKNLLILDELPNTSPLLASAYAACDTFVLPSKFETPGISAMEAGVAGAKIVITPYGGTKEYFGDMARYVDPYSTSSIKAQIEASLNEQKNNQLQSHLIKHFNWDIIAEKTLNVYRTLLDR